MPGLDPARAPVIVAGLVVLREILARYGLGAIEVSERDLLDGAALAAAELPEPDEGRRPARRLHLLLSAHGPPRGDVGRSGSAPPASRSARVAGLDRSSQVKALSGTRRSATSSDARNSSASGRARPSAET